MNKTKRNKRGVVTLTDKERIFLSILEHLYLTQVLCLRGIHKQQFQDAGSAYVHFGTYDEGPIQVGDLVMGITGRISEVKIGVVVEIYPNRELVVIREIGTERLVNYHNERFVRIVGMSPSLLLEGAQYEFQQKVMRAFQNGGEYWYRFGGVEFLENQVARIWVREAFGGGAKPSNPFSFEMRWNKKTSVKAILTAMRENGYGTKKFDSAEDQNQN